MPRQPQYRCLADWFADPATPARELAELPLLHPDELLALAARDDLDEPLRERALRTAVAAPPTAEWAACRGQLLAAALRMPGLTAATVRGCARDVGYLLAHTDRRGAPLSTTTCTALNAVTAFADDELTIDVLVALHEMLPLDGHRQVRWREVLRACADGSPRVVSAFALTRRAGSRPTRDDALRRLGEVAALPDGAAGVLARLLLDDLHTPVADLSTVALGVTVALGDAQSSTGCTSEIR